MADTLRVLISPRKSDPRIYVAECLETGYVTTGVGYNEAREGILEVLRTEILHAGDKGITRSPVPTTLENQWESVTSEHQPETIELFPTERIERKPPGRVASVKRVTVAGSR